MSLSESPFKSQGRQWICFSEYRMSCLQVQCCTTLRRPKTENVGTCLTAVSTVPTLARNAYRHWTGHRLGGNKSRGSCLPLRIDYALRPHVVKWTIVSKLKVTLSRSVDE